MDCSRCFSSHSGRFVSILNRHADFLLEAGRCFVFAPVLGGRQRSFVIDFYLWQLPRPRLFASC